MASPTDWVRARDAVVTVGGIQLRATTASYRVRVNNVDISNLRGNGWSEFTTDIKSAELSFTVAVSAAEGAPALEVDNYYPASFVTAGGLSHTGTVLITGVDEQVGPRGAYLPSYTSVFNGAVT